MPDDERSWRDEDRPSWRELDKMKDRSRHRKDEKPAFEGNKRQQAYGRSLALGRANELFKEKKNPEQMAAEEALEKAKGTSSFEELAQAYFEKYGLTKDWRVHLLLAETAASGVAVPAIEALLESAAKLDKTERRGVVSKLKTIAMTGKMKSKAAAKRALEVLES